MNAPISANITKTLKTKPSKMNKIAIKRPVAKGPPLSNIFLGLI